MRRRAGTSRFTVGGVRREDGGEQRKDGRGDSWLRRGLHWQNGMGHHDRLVADNRTK